MKLKEYKAKLKLQELKTVIQELLDCPDLNHNSLDDITAEAIHKAHVALDI